MKGVSFGSGTLVHAHGELGLVITNWHVVRDAPKNVSVVFPDGFHSPARVLKMDRDWDLAALLIQRPNVSPVKLATTSPSPGDPLTIAGYGSGTYRAATGKCMQYVAPGTRFPHHMLEVSAVARQGDSGGPIFNQRGELAGVLFGATRRSTTGSYVGRVRWFAASVAPAMQTGDEVLIARAPCEGGQCRPTNPTLPHVIQATPFDPPAVPASEDANVGTPPVVAATVNQPANKPIVITWDDVAGTTIYERLKTVLAAIGVLSLLAFSLRARK